MMYPVYFFLSIWRVSVVIFHIDIPAGLTRCFIKFMILYDKTWCAALPFIVLAVKMCPGPDTYNAAMHTEARHLSPLF